MGAVLMWEELGSSVRMKRAHHRATVVADTIIFFYGGFDGQSYSPELHAFDTVTQKLLTGSHLESGGSPLPLIGHVLGMMDGQLYTLMGFDGTRYSNSVYTCNPTILTMNCNRGSSTPMDRLLVNGEEWPQPRRDCAYYFSETHIFLFGGWDMFRHCADLHVWFRKTSQWKLMEQGETWPIPRRGAAMVMSGSKLYMFGGNYGHEKYLNDLWVLDTRTSMSEWEQVSAVGDIPSPRAWHSMVVVDESFIVLFGGMGEEGVCYNTLHMLDLESLQWQEIIVDHESKPVKRHSHAAAFVGGKMYLAGGMDGEGNVLDDFYCVEVLKE